jgi:hypothetical protein
MNTNYPTFSEMFSGAGIMIYTQHNEEFYVLLGEGRDGFSDFGGGRDRGEKHPIDTATREFLEETCHSVLDDADAIKNILVQTTCTVFAANYLQYWVHIPYNADIDTKFKQNQSKFGTSKYHLEMKRMLWVPVSEIRTAIAPYVNVDPKTQKQLHLEKSNIHLRKHLVKLIAKAEKDGILELLN